MSKWILDMMIESAVVLVSIIDTVLRIVSTGVAVRLVLVMDALQGTQTNVRSTVESNVCA